MKKMTHCVLNTSSHRTVRLGTLVLCAALLGGYSLLAGDGKDGKSPIAPEQAEPTYNNWLDLSLGGLLISGDKAQFHQEHSVSGPVFGGIEDMHLEKSFANKAQLSLDAHAIFDNNDYKVKLELSQADVGYIKAGFTEFRTWYNGNGGYFPFDNLFIRPYPNDDLALDRSNTWIELGLREPTLPEITLRYEHVVRNGLVDSTEWGSDNLTLMPTKGQNNAVRKIAPAFRDMNEKRDIITLDIKKTFAKTDFDLGMRYEYTNNYDTLNTQNLPGTLGTLAKNTHNIPLAASGYYTTETDENRMNLFNGNYSSVTRFNDHLWLTLGYSYTSAFNSTGGSQINGPDYDSNFGNGYFLLNNQLVYVNGSEFLNLSGGSQSGQNVGTLNLMWMPTDDLTITPSVRFENNDTQSDSLFFTTLNQTNKTVGGVPIVVAKPGVSPTPTYISSTDDIFNVAESLELRYTGVKNWVFYAQGDWEEENENRLDSSPGTGSASSIRALNATVTRLKQKYDAGANWYPLPRLNLSMQYYHQCEQYDQTFHFEDPTQGNQRLLDQNWSTDDVNMRVTWMALSNLSLVSRYDYQKTLIYSQWKSVAAPGFVTGNGESGKITDNMFSECLTWNPVNRLYIQGNVSYVLNNTNSPAANEVPAIQKFSNDYWTASLGTGFAIDDKTELQANYTFYRATDYVNNDLFGMPYGSDATEHEISVGITRQIAKNVRVMLKYSFDYYRDPAAGGYNNYDAQTIYSCMQIRF